MTMKKRITSKKAISRPKVKDIKRIDTGEFLDRDLSLLEFNKRVLEQAIDPNIPLLERLRYLSIFHSNLDEFFMKRVDVSRRVKIITVPKAGGTEQMVSYEQHKLIRNATISLLDTAANCFEKNIKPLLQEKGMRLIEWNELKDAEREYIETYFKQNIFPVLTPLSVDPGHPFPHISNLSTSLAVSLRYSEKPDLFFARVKIPKVFPQWILLPNVDGKQIRFIALEKVVKQKLDQLFPNMEIVNAMPFRMTRSIDLDPDEDNNDDLLAVMEEVLKQRRYGLVVKLEVPPQPDPWLLNFLMTELEINENDIYEMKSLLNFTSLAPIYGLEIPEHRYKSWNPVVPKELGDEKNSLFAVISTSDFLVHHPYESYQATTENFINNVANDPNVLAIKMTLYRTNDDSQMIKPLVRAAEAGKQVVCLIEVKARLDEAKNISWAHSLEEAGAHVVYGVVGLKTHCKVALVVRQEGDKISTYAHIGTGNYNAITAKQYTDFGYFTSKPEITTEIIELFHHLTGRSQKREYKNLMVAPTNFKKRILEMIERETQFAKAGKPGAIIAKCNGLDDYDICRAFYEASKAGVSIDLIVRGMCVVKPGVPGLSENIRVVSIVDRFLEHARIYYFRNGQEQLEKGDFYIGSGDLMNRNLERRVEVCVPILAEEHKRKLYEVLKLQLDDRVQAWQMNNNGSYKRLVKASGTEASSQQILMLKAFEFNKHQ